MSASLYDKNPSQFVGRYGELPGIGCYTSQASEVEVAIRYILLTYRSLADFKYTPHLVGYVLVVIFLLSNPIPGVLPSRTLDT